MNSSPFKPHIEATGAAFAGVQGCGTLDAGFNGLAQLAARLCNRPVASIVVDGSGATWCSAIGAMPPDTGSRTDPYSSLTRSANDVFSIRDVRDETDVGTAKTIAGGLEVRSYAGIALRAASGEILGTLAVYDGIPRELPVEQRAMLVLLAEQAVCQLELRARLAEQMLVTGPQRTRSIDAGDAALGHALLESAPVAIYHTDGAGHSAYFNPAYRKMFGVRHEETDADWVQWVHPDDRPRMKDAWADFGRRPRPMRFEYRSDPVKGAVRVLAEQVVPVGGGRGFVGTITDVTELIAARDDLREMETLFRNTFEQAPIGVAYANRGGTFLRCNVAFCELLGYRADELEGRSGFDLTHLEDVTPVTAALTRLWSGETEFVDIETRYIHKRGHVLWVRLTTALVREGGAAPVRAVEFLRDITVRKQLASELLQNQILLEAVIANLPVGLLACDASGRVTHHNPAAAALFGIPDDSTLPSDWARSEVPTASIFFADGTTRLTAAELPLARALSGESIDNLELVIVPDGIGARATLANGRPLAGPDGHTLGAVAVFQDITERKAADLELERVHKQLMAASRQAGMAEVATNVLHNVGNILNSINISASLVADRVRQSKAGGLTRVAALLKSQGANLGEFISADERGKQIPDYLSSLGEQLVGDQKATLEEITSLRDNLEHIKETVTMQQTYAKLCGVTEVVNVNDLVEDSLRLNAGAFARHGVTLERDYGGPLPITVDKHKVLQILVNLVRNAKYACDESGRQDKLLTLRVEATETGARISIIDNGVGIAPDNMGRLFHHGFTTRQSGHGFGLHSGAVAAQELGGTLRAESAGLGHGAAFILELPRLPPGAERG